MPWRLSAALSAFLIVHCTAVTAQPDSADALVRQLGADSYRLRKSAGKELLEMKTAAVDALGRGLESTDPEIRDRCRSILAAIEADPVETRLRAFVEAKTGSLPGWDRFAKVVGPKSGARELFAEIYRVDRELLATLQQNPKSAKAMLIDRASRLNRELSKMDSREIVGRSAGLVYAAASLSSLDRSSFSSLSNALARTEVAQFLSGKEIVRELLDKIMRRNSDTSQLYQTFNLAQKYRLTDFTRDRLGPALKKQFSAAMQGRNSIYAIQTVAYQAKQAGLTKLLEEDIVPAIQKWAKSVASNPDLNKLYTLINLSRTVEMTEILETSVRPAFVKWLETTRDPIQSGRAYQLAQIARTLKLEKELESRLRPVMEGKMLAASMNPDRNTISRLIGDAQNLGMQKSVDAFLNPAVESLVLQAVERRADFNEIQQLIYLTQRFSMSRVVDRTLKPYVRDQAAALSKKTISLSQASQIFSVARQLNMQKTVEKEIKPALKRTFQSLQKRPINSSSLYQALSLADTLRSKEVLEYVLRAASSNRVSSYLRARAIYAVGKLGGKEQIAKLAKLVDDKSTIGTRTINGLTVTTRLGDVALAAAVHLSGQSLQSYGFDYAVFQKQDFLTMSYYYMGFGKDQMRQQARRRWQAWQAKNRP